MKVVWQEEQEGDRNLFSEKEYAHCVLNCIMEKKYVFIYTVGGTLQKIVEVVVACPWKRLQGEIDSVS